MGRANEVQNGTCNRKNNTVIYNIVCIIGYVIFNTNDMRVDTLILSQHVIVQHILIYCINLFTKNSEI